MFRKVLVSAVALSLITGPVALAAAADNGHTPAGAKQGTGPQIVMLSRLGERNDGGVTSYEFGNERTEVLRNAGVPGSR